MTTTLRRLAGLLSGAALLGLAACDQGPSTVSLYVHPAGSLDFLVAATRHGGPLYLEIDGMPFADSDGLDSRLGGIMEEAQQSRELRLTTDQTAAEDPRFRLALVFNPRQGDDVFAFCREQPEGGPPRHDGRIELRAGFCRGDDLLAAVDGWAEEVETLDDPKIEQLLRQVARELFSRNRNDD